MTEKISINTSMRAFDRKHRRFYDEIPLEERKKFSTYLMMKYGANVEGITELQEYYLRAHNERVNLHFYDLGRHPKLQWLLCTTVSPNMGSQRHFWLAPAQRRENRSTKFLEKLYPGMNNHEIELLAEINSTAQLKELARKMGWDEDRIKKEL